MSLIQLDQFVVEDLTLALKLDGLNESHPILQEVGHPDEINALFDSISYSKVCVCVCVCDPTYISQSHDYHRVQV